MTYHCMVCTREVPEDRVKRRAKTCTKECGRILRLDYLRRKRMVSRPPKGIPPITNDGNTVPTQKEGM